MKSWLRQPMKGAVLSAAIAIGLSACSPTSDLPSLADVQAMLPGESLSLQVLPPPARYAQAVLALEAAGKIEIVPVAPAVARDTCNGSGACSYIGLFHFCRITISTEYTGEARAALLDHERAHCAGWPKSHPL